MLPVVVWVSDVVGVKGGKEGLFTTVSPRATKLLGQREPSFSNMLSSFFGS